MEFQDLLYGRICLPDWLAPFLRIPEFVRLRGIRLSNVDSLQFKDFGNANRWEHGVAAAYLATRVATARTLPRAKAAELTLAGLLHDVATPPFAHTAEHVLEGFDHELTSQMLLAQRNGADVEPTVAVLGSATPQFHRECEALSQRLKVDVDPDEVARMIIGQGELGFLISGTLDLDNADNVIRGCALMGMPVDKQLPIRIADWLAAQNDAPTPLSDVADPDVQDWLRWRSAYYHQFYRATDEEAGREAFLRHLMRRALSEGLPRRVLIWNTDEGLLSAMSKAGKTKEGNGVAPLSELVERYRLLESPTLVDRVPVDSEAELKPLLSPRAAAWIEEYFAEAGVEACVMPARRRFDATNEVLSLFPAEAGYLAIWRIGTRRGKTMGHTQAPVSSASLRAAVRTWSVQQPWQRQTKRRFENVRQSLDAFGDWSFRAARNESPHAYPSTFVHAIPAALISALGLREEAVLDPFGGTGQTAAEVLRAGGTATTADANTVATLVARARFVMLEQPLRDKLLGIESSMIRDLDPVPAPEFALRAKWHDKRTVVELCQIKRFITARKDPQHRLFLNACFSAIIPSATGRRGKQHGFFADNTPLGAAETAPPYVDAVSLFIQKVARNVRISQRFQAQLERGGQDPSEVLMKRIRVLQLSVAKAELDDYGIQKGDLGGVITSPPYLCMADYTLGQRLSYYWMFPEKLDEDFALEVGARRRRSQKKNSVLEEYFAALEKFAALTTTMVRKGGFVSVILGAPVATSFKKAGVFKRFDDLMKRHECPLFWETTRSIHWHRNQGYQRLRKERIAVYRCE